MNIVLLIIVLSFALIFVACVFIVRRYYQVELLREIERARKSEQLKSVFLANVSHALRTPLNAIIGFSEVIKKEKPENLEKGQLEEMVDHIHQNGKQLLYFITELLELSNFESGMLTFTMIEVNLAELMASYRREALPATNPNVSVRIRTDLSPHCKATLDTNLMHQLMMHLLTNAAKHTQKGVITLEYGHERKGIKVTITDTGDGIPAKIKNNLFNTLQNEDSLTLTNQATGLGLSICKSIVDALNGEINLESEEGKGTKATVWFPCQMRDMTKDVA